MGLECKTFQLDVPVWVSKMEGAMWLGIQLFLGFVLGGILLAIVFGLCCGLVAFIKSAIHNHRLAKRWKKNCEFDMRH